MGSYEGVYKCHVITHCMDEEGLPFVSSHAKMSHNVLFLKLSFIQMKYQRNFYHQTLPLPDGNI